MHQLRTCTVRARDAGSDGRQRRENGLFNVILETAASGGLSGGCVHLCNCC
jgi:hypothetical protein